MLFHNTVDQFFIPVIEVGVAPLLRSAFFFFFLCFFAFTKTRYVCLQHFKFKPVVFLLALVKVGLPRQSCYISFKFAPTAA